MRTASEVVADSPNSEDYARANAFLRRMYRYRWISANDMHEMRKMALHGQLEEANVKLETLVRARQRGDGG